MLLIAPVNELFHREFPDTHVKSGLSNWGRNLSHRLKAAQGKLSVGYIIYGMAMGVAGVAQVVLFFVAAKWMTVAEFGLVGVLLIALPLLSRALVLGIDTGYAMRIWRVSPREQTQLLGSTVSAMLVSVVLLLLSSVLLTRAVPAWRLDVTALVVLVAASRAMVDLSLVTLRRSGRVLRVGTIQALRGVFILLLPLAAFWAQGANALTYLAGLLAAEMATTLVMIPLLHQTSQLRIFQPGWRAEALTLLKLGAPALPMMLAMLLTASGDRFVIASVLGLSAVAIYTLGQKFAEYLVQIVFAPFSAALGPIAWQRAAQDMAESARLLNRAAALLICAGGAVVGLVAVGIREAIFKGYGADYADSAVVFLWVAFAVVAAQVAQVFASYFSHAEKLVVPMKIYLSATIGMLLANYALAARVGVVGVAAISAVTYGLVIGLVVWSARKQGGDLWRLRQHFAPLFSYALFLFLVGLVDTTQWPSLMAVSVKLLLWGAFMCTLLSISNEFRSAAIGLLQRLTASLRSV